jgi:hypothetical protein
LHLFEQFAQINRVHKCLQKKLAHKRKVILAFLAGTVVGSLRGFDGRIFKLRQRYRQDGMDQGSIVTGCPSPRQHNS